MSNWMLRGLVFAAVMVVIRLFQGTLIDVWQTHAGLISISLLLVFLIGVVFWGVRDGRADAAANPDPDRRADLAMTWLVAGLVAGVLSGAVAWFIGADHDWQIWDWHIAHFQIYRSLYTGGFINELTVFAAFTALLVFVGGVTGSTVGRFLIDRSGAYTPKAGRGGDDERADTDVFAAVRSSEAASAADGAWAQEQTSAVATAEREEHDAEAYSEEPAYSDESTQKIAWPPKSDATEEIPTKEHKAKTDED
jgi:hypothetical protein